MLASLALSGLHPTPSLSQKTPYPLSRRFLRPIWAATSPAAAAGGPQTPPPLPAGGTTAGLPDLAAPGEAGWVANVMLWHLLCQK